MRKHTYLYTVGALLIGASVLLYWLHYLVFHDPHHIFIYLLGDIAFVPLEVLLVVIVLERLLHSQEKRAMMDKLNMVIGAFFSELGTELMGELTAAVADRKATQLRLSVRPEWTVREFGQARQFAQGGGLSLDSKQLDLESLRRLLADKREFLLRLLENPNLLEHERFSDLLWAVFHLGEELIARKSLEQLPQGDLDHLPGDLTRVYAALATEWVAYAQRLQAEYPFLFSLLVRTHPLQEDPEAVIR